MVTSQILHFADFTKTKKSKYLENATLIFLQRKYFINYTLRTSLWQKIAGGLRRWLHFPVKLHQFKSLCTRHFGQVKLDYKSSLCIHYYLKRKLYPLVGKPGLWEHFNFKDLSHIWTNIWVPLNKQNTRYFKSLSHTNSEWNVEGKDNQV